MSRSKLPVFQLHLVATCEADISTSQPCFVGLRKSRSVKLNQMLLEIKKKQKFHK